MPARSVTSPWAILGGPSSRICCGVRRHVVSGFACIYLSAAAPCDCDAGAALAGGEGGVCSRRLVRSNLCRSDAEPLKLRHSNSIVPTRAKRTRNRVLVRSIHIALVGGRLDRAAFQLTPPFGSSISTGLSHRPTLAPSLVYVGVCLITGVRLQCGLAGDATLAKWLPARARATD